MRDCDAHPVLQWLAASHIAYKAQEGVWDPSLVEVAAATTRLGQTELAGMQEAEAWTQTS